MADKPVVEVVAVDAALDALSSPTSSDVYEAVDAFNEKAVAAAAARRALEGGGGGSLPTGWTGDSGDPESVNSNGADLTVSTLNATNVEATGEIALNGVPPYFPGTSLDTGGSDLATSGGDVATSGGGIDTGGGNISYGTGRATGMGAPQSGTDGATQGSADARVGGLVIADQADGFLNIASGGMSSPAKAAFVANGSTVDQLRDSLIAAGFMDAS